MWDALANDLGTHKGWHPIANHFLRKVAALHGEEGMEDKEGHRVVLGKVGFGVESRRTRLDVWLVSKGTASSHSKRRRPNSCLSRNASFRCFRSCRRSGNGWKQGDGVPQQAAQHHSLCFKFLGGRVVSPADGWLGKGDSGEDPRWTLNPPNLPDLFWTPLNRQALPGLQSIGNRAASGSMDWQARDNPILQKKNIVSGPDNRDMRA